MRRFYWKEKTDLVTRRGEDNPEDDYDPFDEVVRERKRPNEDPSPLEPKKKISITDEQRLRMEEMKARALAKKAEREAAKKAAEAQSMPEVSSEQE